MKKIFNQTARPEFISEQKRAHDKYVIPDDELYPTRIVNGNNDRISVNKCFDVLSKGCKVYKHPVKTRRIRRSNKKIKHVCKFVYSNIRGLSGKTQSLKQIVMNIDPDIILICETHLTSDRNVNIPDYRFISRPRKQGNNQNKEEELEFL